MEPSGRNRHGERAMREWSARHNDAGVLMMLSSSLPLSPSGYGVRSHAIASHLLRHGVRLHVCTRPGYPLNAWNGPRPVRPRDTVENVTYHRLPLYPVGMGEFGDAYREQAASLIAGEAARCRASIIHMENGLPSMLAARKSGIKAIYEYRGMWHYSAAARNTWFPWTEPYQRRQRLELQTGALADACFAISEALKAELVANGLAEDKITVLPNAVDVERFTPLPPDRELLEKYRLEGRLVVGFIGSFTAYEGLDALLDAVLELNWRGFPVSLLMVGDGADNLQRMKALHQARGSHPAVIFTGRVPFEDVPRYYSLIDIMPFPRINAKVCRCVPPLKPLEAMAMGKTVLVSDVAALTEIVRDGETGLVFAADHVADLVRKLETLATTPELRQRLAHRGREWVVAERDWRIVSQRILRVYENLLEK